MSDDFIVLKRERSAPRLQIFFPEEGRTKQSERDSCDINRMVAKYGIGALAMSSQLRGMNFSDAPVVSDFKESLDKVMSAQDSFDRLPAVVRKRFHNDPSEFVDFCTNPDTTFEELQEFGLTAEVKGRKRASNTLASGPSTEGPQKNFGPAVPEKVTPEA